MLVPGAFPSHTKPIELKRRLRSFLRHLFLSISVASLSMDPLCKLGIFLVFLRNPGILMFLFLYATSRWYISSRVAVLVPGAFPSHKKSMESNPRDVCVPRYSCCFCVVNSLLLDPTSKFAIFLVFYWTTDWIVLVFCNAIRKRREEKGREQNKTTE